MKNRIRILLALCALCGLGCGCKNYGVAPSPSPVVTPRVTAAPTATAAPAQSGDLSPATSSTPLTSPAVGMTPGASSIPDTAAGSADATLPGFKEGEKVDAAQAPQVEQAIKKEYPNAKITGITYAMQGNRQAYHVVLSGDKVTDVYVDAMGVVSPYSPAASASPAA